MYLCIDFNPLGPSLTFIYPSRHALGVLFRGASQDVKRGGNMQVLLVQAQFREGDL